jgi:hypothetical protein
MKDVFFIRGFNVCNVCMFSEPLRAFISYYRKENEKFQKCSQKFLVRGMTCLISSGYGLLRRVTQDETTIDARLLTRARVNNEAGGNLAVQTGKPARIRASGDKRIDHKVTSED